MTYDQERTLMGVAAGMQQFGQSLQANAYRPQPQFIQPLPPVAPLYIPPPQPTQPIQSSFPAMPALGTQSNPIRIQTVPSYF
jgi:hypothetical protein